MDRRARAGRNDRTHTGDSAGYVGDASTKQSASRCLFLPFAVTAIARRLHHGDLPLAAACLGVGHGISEQGAPHRMPVAWTIEARAGDVAWRDPGPFVDATIQHHEGLPRGTGASGLHIIEGWGKIGGMGSGTVPDAVSGLQSAQCPLQSVMVCRALSRLSAISSCVAHATHSASAYRIAPPAILSYSRGFPTVFVEECNRSFPPLASAFLGPSNKHLFSGRAAVPPCPSGAVVNRMVNYSSVDNSGVPLLSRKD